MSTESDLTRWKVAVAVFGVLSVVACLLNILGESPLAAARREQAVGKLTTRIEAVHISVAELKALVAELRGARP